jgi:hypothetical protein
MEEFLPLKGRKFLAHCDPRPAALDLFDVLPRKQTPGVARQSFILIFRSEPAVLLGTGMYVMKSDGFGPDIIYIEGIALPADADAPAGHYYQSVFN